MATKIWLGLGRSNDFSVPEDEIAALPSISLENIHAVQNVYPSTLFDQLLTLNSNRNLLHATNNLSFSPVSKFSHQGVLIAEV